MPVKTVVMAQMAVIVMMPVEMMAMVMASHPGMGVKHAGIDVHDAGAIRGSARVMRQRGRRREH